MNTFNVSFVVTVLQGHPRKWVADAVNDGLSTSEDILEWEVNQQGDAGENGQVSYKVTMTIALHNGYPDWIVETLEQALDAGESITEFEWTMVG